VADEVHACEPLIAVTAEQHAVVELERSGGASPGTIRGARRDRFAAEARVFVRTVVEVLPAWLVARAVVLASLGLAHATVSTVRPHNPGAAARVHQGLLAWDAGWYASIARHGYVSSGLQSVRFFPVYPFAARVLGWVPGMGVGPALVLLANLCALAAMAALVVLVRSDLGDAALARRSVWLLALAPAAYSLVLGYADAALLLCAIVTVLAARKSRWWWAAAAGLLAGGLRPLGLLLVVPVVVEVWRTRRDRRDAMRWVATGAAVLAPLAGAGAYLGWVGAQFGDPWLPLRIQQQGGHRGPLAAPFAAMWHNATSVLHGHHLGSALHIPWVLLCLVLLVVAFARLPVTYGAFAAAVLAVSLTSSNLDSFERYALGAFPLVIAASTLTARRSVEMVVLIGSAVAMAGYAYLAFVGIVVP
jgi:Mannosyltransferase (PIG-V)